MSEPKSALLTQSATPRTTSADRNLSTDHAILEFWKSEKIFEKSQVISETSKKFVFFDGPPGTNGTPHIGHVMQSSLKDLFPRFKTMQGYVVMRKAGWDTHGLPVELTAEADLGLKTKRDVEKVGVQAFVDHCRNTVLRYRDDWVKVLTRLGRFIDFDDDYLTMSNSFIQSDWWTLKQSYDKGLVYKDFKIVPFCTRCGTALSSHEVAQGYEDVNDLTVTVLFQLENEPNTYFAAWTTTPWTLLGNLGLAVGAEIEYSLLNANDGTEKKIILASKLVPTFSDVLPNATVEKTMLGSELVGTRYRSLFPSEHWPTAGERHVVVADDFVTTDDGTGIVHLALYGEDDFRLIRQHDLLRVQHVGADGIINDLGGRFQGRFFRDEEVAVDIIKDLAKKGTLLKKARHEHPYPFCWRCKSPLLYFGLATWFLKTTAIRDLMLAENDSIQWFPEHIREGRFGNWLKNNVDWAISRDRYWGSPLNIWTHEQNPEERICVASVAELQRLGATYASTGKPIAADMDLHMPIIDDVVIRSDDGAVYRRERGVLDCWYNAGAMPWGQFGYPAKQGSVAQFENQFPADFICEGIDQTRGWFYTLLALSCAVAGKTSFKNVICTEMILDAQGKKMSKSLGNGIEPYALMEEFGADAVRWTFFDSDPWLVKRYSKELPREARRAIFIPLENCFSFFETYSELDGWKPTAKRSIAEASRPALDRWIRSSLAFAIAEITDALEKYDVARASKAHLEFLDQLSNWYIRRSRRRFWKSNDDFDKTSAYETLYDALVTVTHLLAPFAPFITERLYQSLVVKHFPDAAESVHLSQWPSASDFVRDQALDTEISIVREAASLARSLRTTHNLKVRQPLGQMRIVPHRSEHVEQIKRHCEELLEEVNIKAVDVLADGGDSFTLVAKPNWANIGKALGDKTQIVASAISKLTLTEILALKSGESIKVAIGDGHHEIHLQDILIQAVGAPGSVAATGESVTVALDTTLTPDLVEEGHARELVSMLQKQRKEKGLEVADRVTLTLATTSDFAAVIERFGKEIQDECLVVNLIITDQVAEPDGTIEVHGHTVNVKIDKYLASSKHSAGI